ncbi:hypothetical protein P5673_027790 [Acropora cervicornis]|uniref:Uncharacterized protein n=1 Tax=Acropora cervicornis TaxID=6130 RepID=A0AAD9UVE1_ACRCE|nr:hypothetical protein P5673_027790 [Acropora cervicornis]
MSSTTIAQLLLDPPKDKVASKAPVKCQENKVFVIDKNSPCFRNPEDSKAIGLGVFRNDGSHVVAYYKEKAPEIRLDREDALEKGTSPYLPTVTWLACIGHIEEDCKRKLQSLGEEDCKRKLQSLGISSQHCTAFLHDIFVSDVKHEKGLIDSDGCKDFNDKLESLQNVWNLREKKIRSAVLPDSSEAEFHKYFVTHIAQDMKKKMISPVRKRAGFGESFFYNNAAESRHQRIKARKGHMYGERKLAWT